MKKLILAIAVCLLAPANTAFSGGDFDFTLHKLESGRPGPTILVVGGIQGDEPGGFNAAALVVTHYKILKGSVWVVPNLNFISIIKRTRGFYGDLNRKFANIKETDPEYPKIQKIKEIILDDSVDLVLNLHDGSGFYRPRYVDKTHNPDRWGQCVIVDREQIPVNPFGNLTEIASTVVAEVNHHILDPEHRYHVNNTKTHLGNEEMSKTLTYFAIRNQKPAFGLEVSKGFPTHTRSYYHLRLTEAFMALAGIQYERLFELSAKAVNQAIKGNAQVALYDHRIFLDVADARGKLRFVPLKKDADIQFTPSNPLMAIVSNGKSYRVHHGNRRLTWLQPQYFDYDSSIRTINMQIDGSEEEVRFGRMVEVNQAFKVLPRKGYRVNVIGFRKTGIRNESGVVIRKGDVQKQFSVDKAGRIYRVEVYRKKKFSGMVLVHFGRRPQNLLASDPLRLSMVRPSESQPPYHEHASSPVFTGR